MKFLQRHWPLLLVALAALYFVRKYVAQKNSGVVTPDTPASISDAFHEDLNGTLGNVTLPDATRLTSRPGNRPTNASTDRA